MWDDDDGVDFQWTPKDFILFISLVLSYWGLVAVVALLVEQIK